MRKNKFLAFGLALYFLLSNSILNCTGIDKKSVVIKQKFNQLEKNFCSFFGLPLLLFAILKFNFFYLKKIVDDDAKHFVPLLEEFENNFLEKQLYSGVNPQIDEHSTQVPDPPQASNQSNFQQAFQPLNQACFNFDKEIGAGAYGAAYEVTRRTDGQKFCLKLGHFFNEKGLLRLQEETKILMYLNHPNIVKCFGGFIENSFYHAILELVEGDCLEKYFQPGRNIKFGYILNYFLQLLSAVYYCHESKVIHRDIKLANVMLERNTGKVKLLDFGVSKKLLTDQYFTTTMIGTPTNYAPEFFCKNNLHGLPVDIWALGTTFYQMLTGKFPFCGGSLKEISYKVFNENFPPLNLENFTGGLDKDIIELLNGMLDKNPNSRWKIYDVVAFTKHIAEKYGFCVNNKWDLCAVNNSITIYY